MSIAKIIPVIISILFYSITLHSADRVIYAGTRASSYGAYPRPTCKQWVNIFYNMAEGFNGSKPAAIWGIGRMGPKSAPGCIVEFESDGQIYENVTFEVMPDLNHEELLSYFDDWGINVFLFVEPGQADVLLLMELIFKKFGHHTCVAGFGVDAEWYKATGQQNPNEKIAIPDSLAEIWEKKVQSYNSRYKLLLKHWDYTLLTKNYRGDILFVDDSQGFTSISSMTNEFAQWANIFKPNPVVYQIGYSADKKLWGTLSNPPKELGTAIINSIASATQKVGIFWVDFTLKDDELQFLFDDVVAIQNDQNSSQSKDRNGTLLFPCRFNNSEINIIYDLPIDYNNVLLNIVKVNGEIVRFFSVRNRKGAILWNSNNYAPGMYIINLQAGNHSIVSEAVIVK